MSNFSKFSSLLDWEDVASGGESRFPDDCFEIQGDTFIAKFLQKGNFEYNRFGNLINHKTTAGCNKIKIEIGALVEQSYIYIPDSIPVVSFSVDENNEFYKSIDGNLYSKDGKILHNYARARGEKSFTVPNGVEVIGFCAFLAVEGLTEVIFADSVKEIRPHAFSRSCDIVSIQLNEGLKTIENGAFINCLGLKDAYIPSTVSTIGVAPFASCTSLFGIDVNKDNEFYKSENGVLYSKDGARLIQYPAGKSTVDFTISKCVTTICESAFCRCKNLETVKISAGVKCIEQKAFDACAHLEMIFIPRSVDSIGNFAFRGCDALTIYCENDKEQRGWFGAWNFSNCPVIWNAE